MVVSPQPLAEGPRAERARQFEVLALELFAASGYRNVTVDQVAVAAGVATRTIFRYFPTKEDLVLAVPRRHMYGLALHVDALPESDDPVASVWGLLLDLTGTEREGVEDLALWYRATEDAPELAARILGERALVVGRVLTDYCARCLGVDPDHDVRPHVLAAALHAAERALLDFWGRGKERQELQELFASALEPLTLMSSDRTTTGKLARNPT